MPELRNAWNAPDRSDRYLIEHPVVARTFIANRYGADTNGETLHPYIIAGLKKHKEASSTNGNTWQELVEVPERPSVLVRNGSYGDETASNVPCADDSDWHREGDIIWFTGSIYCIINKSQSMYKGWNVEWRPEMVVCIAKMKVRHFHVSSTFFLNKH